VSFGAIVAAVAALLIRYLLRSVISNHVKNPKFLVVRLVLSNL
jgi:hypothetical protein